MSEWRCVACGQASCRGGEFCAAWTARSTSLAGSGAFLGRTPKPELMPKVRSTGMTRRMDGRREMQYTDGRQTWWAVAREAA